MISLSGGEKIQLHPPLTISAFLSLAVMNRFGWRSLPLWATAEDCSLLILDFCPHFLHMQTICSLIFGVFQPLMSPVYHVWLQQYKHIYYYNPTKWLSLTRTLTKMPSICRWNANCIYAYWYPSELETYLSISTIISVLVSVLYQYIISVVWL